MVLRTLKSPLDCKEIQLQGDQSWVFFGRTDAKAETPILCELKLQYLMRTADPLEKTLMLGKIEGRRRRG